MVLETLLFPINQGRFSKMETFGARNTCFEFLTTNGVHMDYGRLQRFLKCLRNFQGLFRVINYNLRPRVCFRILQSLRMWFVGDYTECRGFYEISKSQRPLGAPNYLLRSRVYFRILQTLSWKLRTRADSNNSWGSWGHLELPINEICK